MINNISSTGSRVKRANELESKAENVIKEQNSTSVIKHKLRKKFWMKMRD